MQNQQRSILSKVLIMLAVYWIITGVGLFVGGYVPKIFMLPISIVTFALLFISSFRSKFGVKMGVLISFLVGITLRTTLEHYLGTMGIELVVGVFVTTILTFCVFGMFGYITQRDLSGFGGILTLAIILLVIFSLVAIFFPFGGIVSLIVSFLAVLIFSAAIVYDFNIIAQGHITEKEVPLVALNLYLSFVNIFTSLLNIVSSVVR